MTSKSPKPINLREQIAADISRAIDSSTNYSGKEYEQNRHNWVQITADRAIAAFVQSLPEPIDIEAKYEGHNGGVDITLDGEDDRNMVDYLTAWANDCGFNYYYRAVMENMRRLYSPTSDMIQSGHEEHSEEQRSTSGPQQEDSDESDNSEPSKVR